MSQSQIPAFYSWAGWKDEDFYGLKLVCDRVDRIGFLFYLLHPKHAMRDLRLWLKFRNVKPVSKRIKKTWFKTGKKKKDFKVLETKPEFADLAAIEKKIDEMVDKNKEQK